MKKQFGLIFDVDGVIADTEEVNARATAKVLEENFNIRNVVRSDFDEGLGRGAREYVASAGRVRGIELTDQQLAIAVVARQDEFLAMLESDPLPPFPGVMNLVLGAMESDEFDIAIATSSTRTKSEAVLKSVGIPYDKMVYINGDRVKKRKPDPELFLLAAQEMGLPPKYCCVIEDAPAGVAAARAAGATCIAVTNSADAEELAAADMVVDSLAEIGLGEIARVIQDAGS